MTAVSLPACSGVVNEPPIAETAVVGALSVGFLDQGDGLHTSAAPVFGTDSFDAVLEYFADPLQPHDPLTQDLVRDIEHGRLTLQRLRLKSPLQSAPL